MSVELHAEGEAVRPPSGLEAVLGAEPEERVRPNLSGDLPTVFEVAPMFRRAVSGYDRYQVDTYVQWAENELATADRERRHLEVRHERTRAALDEAQELLSHSAGGGGFVQASRHIGSLLAVAADEAEMMRAEAAAERAAALAETQRAVTGAERLLADAEVEAQRVVGEAITEVERVVAEGGRILDEARRTLAGAQAEAAARLAEVRAAEERAADQADDLRAQVLDEALAARLRARDEIVRMLGTAREERRRADAEAAAARERRDREVVARYVSLVAEVDALERRRDTLRAEIEVPRARAADPQPQGLDVHLRRILDRFQVRSRSLRAP